MNKDSNERQSELREGAEAGKFCKRQSLEAKLGIAVKRDRARHESRLPLIKRGWCILISVLVGSSFATLRYAQSDE